MKYAMGNALERPCGGILIAEMPTLRAHSLPPPGPLRIGHLEQCGK